MPTQTKLEVRGLTQAQATLAAISAFESMIMEIQNQNHSLTDLIASLFKDGMSKQDHDISVVEIDASKDNGKIDDLIEKLRTMAKKGNKDE